MIKASSEDEPSIDGSIDTERIVIDPDYRRAVLALLRRASRDTDATQPAQTEPAVGKE